MAKKKTTTPTNDEVLGKAIKRFKDSWYYAQGSWHKRWERDWKLYNNQRVRVSYEGITDTFIPMTFSTIETMVAALGNGRPRFDFEPEDPTMHRKTKELNSLIDDYWEADRWDVKIVEALRQMLTVGTAPLFFYWDIDRPRMVHFSIRDAIIDPTATSPENLKYAGRRYLDTYDNLDSFEVIDTDPKSKTYGEFIKRYKLPQKIELTGTPSSYELDKEVKEMFIGSTLEKPEQDQVEVIEIWDCDRVVTVLNRKFVIEDIENPYKVQARTRGDEYPKGIIPFVFLRNYTDVSQFYAKSEVEPIAPLQEYLNDYSNMEGDAVVKTLAAQRELDPDYEDWLDLIDDDAATVYPFKPGSLQYIAPPVIPSQAFNERLNIKNEIRETTAIDQVAKGAANVKSTTATEVQAQLNQAGQRVEIKARMLEKDGFYYMGKILFRMIQLYVAEPMAVSADGIDSREQVTFNGVALPPGTAVFNPADYQGEWTPHVSLDITAEQKREQSRRDHLEAYQILIQDPTNNLTEIKKRLLPKIFDLDPEDIEAIMTAPEQAPGMALPPDATAGTLPMPGGMPNAI